MSASSTSQLEASLTLRHSQPEESTLTLRSQPQRSPSLLSQPPPLLSSSSIPLTIPQPPSSLLGPSLPFSAPLPSASPLLQYSPHSSHHSIEHQLSSSHRSDPLLGRRVATNQYVPSTDEVRSLESFERQLDKFHSHKLTLLKQADDAVTSLGVTTLILLALFGYTTGSNLTAVIANDACFTCLSGFGLVFLSMLCFALGFGVSLFIFFWRITNLANPAEKLKDRHKKLLLDIESFREEFESRRLVLSIEDVSHPLVGRPNSLIMESAFGRRLGALSLPSQPWEISKSYTSVIILIDIGAFCVAFTITLMSWFIFCHGNGGEKLRDLGLRHPS